MAETKRQNCDPTFHYIPRKDHSMPFSCPLSQSHLSTPLFSLCISQFRRASETHFSNMAPTPSKRELPGHLMHKNRLQEYTQKSGKNIPVYETTNEGYPHAPKFTSSVYVDGKKYTSNLKFLHLKEAEQDVARLALECITKTENTTQDFCPVTFIRQNPAVCKSTLLEFCLKNELGAPVYKTEQGKSMVFVSSLKISGKIYTGDVSRSKKLAEQVAACTAIQSFIRSNLGNELTKIIKAKAKLVSSSNVVQKSKRILSEATEAESSPPTKIRRSHLSSEIIKKATKENEWMEAV